VRTCDNCGTFSDEAACPSCGKPFPPPVPSEPREEQVEFEPPARIQYSAASPAPASTSAVPAYRPAASQPVLYRRDAFRYRGPSDVRFQPEPTESIGGVVVLGFLSVIFAFLGGYLGIVFGVITVILGRRGMRRGARYAQTAVFMGVLGILIGMCVIFIMAMMSMM
jgi:hypothetical protein